MEYQVFIDSALNISADEFVMKWNSSNHSSDIGIARNATRSGFASQTFGPDITTVVLTVVQPMIIGVITNAIYDFFKAKLTEPPQQKINVKNSEGLDLSIQHRGQKDIEVKYLKQDDMEFFFIEIKKSNLDKVDVPK